jgi:hypothetical protein
MVPVPGNQLIKKIATLTFSADYVPIIRFQKSRVADPDPDPYWTRIQSGQWIRIRNPDPGPGGPKLPTKVGKNIKNSCFEVLDGLF